MKTEKGIIKGQSVTRRICFLLAGLLWPFVILIISDFVDRHILRFSDVIGLCLVPIISLGLISVCAVLVSFLPKKMSKVARWLIGIILTVVTGLVLFILLVLFTFFWIPFDC